MIRSILVIALLSIAMGSFAQMPVIKTITPLSNEVKLYEKFEAKVDLTATYTNPYDYDEVSLRAAITRPDGKRDTIDGYYSLPFTINTSNGNLTAAGGASFYIRYSPSVVGAHSYELILKDKNGSTVSTQQSFQAIAKSNPKNKGFIRTGKTNYLEFDDRTQYVAIGENMCWQNSNFYTNYRDWLSKLETNGGNFIRLWHAHWGLGIEWTNGNNFQGLLKYNQNTSAYQDWLYDYCAEKGIYVMLALQHHGPVSTNVNPNWNESPYNMANGGPCANTWDFFLNDQAKRITKNRYRYIVARWGYSRGIMCWELFNEVEWTNNFETYKPQIIAWHVEMANYIKSLDVYDHILSTSFANDQGADALWNDATMDLTQQHFYGNTSAIHAAVNGLNQNYLEKYDKPTLMGEFGLGGSAPNASIDANGIHIHNGKWSTLLGGSTGTAMTWWWDNYIDPRNLYYHFKGLSKVASEVDFLKNNMKPGSLTTSGAPSDLLLFPALGWGVKGDTLIKVKDGITFPANPALQSFLYGSQFNTQFRSPPNFEVEYTNAGKFTLRTSGNISTSPTKIKISLDGVVKLEMNGAINTSYAIDIPAGKHRISIDNSGTDWIGIASYAFSGQGSMLEGYGVTATDGQSGAVWVLNRDYNHEMVKNGFLPKPINTGVLTVNDVVNTDYKVTLFETLSGDVLSSSIITARDGKLNIKLPAMEWDLAIKFERADLTSIKDITLKTMEIYPNPVEAGGVLNVVCEDLIGKLQAAVFNAEGKLMVQENVQSDGRFSIRLNGDLPVGIYFVKLNNDRGEAVVKGIVVSE